MSESETHTIPLQSSVIKDHLSADILQFCSQHGILQYVPVAVDLIEEYLSPIQGLHIQLEQDPETGEEWLVIDVTIQGDVKEILDEYDKYTDHWVSSVPWPQSDKFRLSYNTGKGEFQG